MSTFDQPVLDHGLVKLLDWMGSDQAIVDAARVSYKGAHGIASADKTLSDKDKKLLFYLMRNRHTSPFEMCELKFAIKAPIFVARQWVRHRTASWNEVSGRYSELPEECYLPELSQITKQSSANRQGRETMSSEGQALLASAWRQELKDGRASSWHTYHKALQNNLAKELARIDLPLSTYTSWIWKIDLHNLLHFLHLRLDPHAQYEIRVYAEAIFAMVKELFPATAEAFEEFVLYGRTLTKRQRDLLELIKYEWLNRNVPGRPTSPRAAIEAMEELFRD